MTNIHTLLRGSVNNSRLEAHKRADPTWITLNMDQSTETCRDRLFAGVVTVTCSLAGAVTVTCRRGYCHLHAPINDQLIPCNTASSLSVANVDQINISSSLHQTMRHTQKNPQTYFTEDSSRRNRSTLLPALCPLSERRTARSLNMSYFVLLLLCKANKGRRKFQTETTPRLQVLRQGPRSSRPKQPFLVDCLTPSRDVSGLGGGKRWLGANTHEAACSVSMLPNRKC